MARNHPIAQPRSDRAADQINRKQDEAKIEPIAGAARDQVEETAKRVGGHAARRATAKVDGFGLPLPRIRGDLPSQRVEITRLQIARKDARGKVAVRTLLRAEGIGKIDSWHELSL